LLEIVALAKKTHGTKSARTLSSDRDATSALSILQYKILVKCSALRATESRPSLRSSCTALAANRLLTALPLVRSVACLVLLACPLSSCCVVLCAGKISNLERAVFCSHLSSIVSRAFVFSVFRRKTGKRTKRSAKYSMKVSQDK